MCNKGELLGSCQGWYWVIRFWGKGESDVGLMMVCRGLWTSFSCAVSGDCSADVYLNSLSELSYRLNSYERFLFDFYWKNTLSKMNGETSGKTMHHGTSSSINNMKGNDSIQVTSRLAVGSHFSSCYSLATFPYLYSIPNAYHSDSSRSRTPKKHNLSDLLSHYVQVLQRVRQYCR